MKRIAVYQQQLTKSYTVSSRLSIAYLIIVACNIFTIAFPYYFWNGPEGYFWKTRDIYREQPNVSFLYKVIVVLQAKSTSSSQPQQEIFVSSMDAINALRQDSFRMANIQFHENDADLDGIVDWFELDVDVPLNPDEEVKSMQAVAFFDYQLTKRVKLQMESVAHVSVESDTPLSEYDTEGDLIFRQAHPLGIRGYKSFLYHDAPLVRTDLAHHVSNSNIGGILARYRTRDIAADYVERYPIKQFDIGASNEKSFRLKMKIKVPTQDVVYIPTLVEILKDAWVKYFSVVLLVWLLLERVKSFAFSHHFL